MTASTATINNNILSSEFFVDFTAAFSMGTSMYDNISRRAKQNQRFMNHLTSSGITERINRPTDNYKYHYSLKASGGHASLKGRTSNMGNPDIIVEQIKHTIQGVKSTTYDWDTKYTEIDWDRVWQAIRLQNTGVPTSVSDVKDFEYMAQHIIRGSHARNFWYLNEIMNGEFSLLTDFEKDIVSPTKGKFDIQAKLFADRPKKFRLTDLLDYEQSLIDQNIILDRSDEITSYQDTTPQIEAFIYIPRVIYNFLLQDLVDNNKDGQNAVLYSYLINDKYNTDFVRGLGQLATNTIRVKAETLPRKFKINNMLIVCANNPESWQQYEQDPAKTILNKKTHKIVMVLKEAFKYNNPKSDSWQEINRNLSAEAERDRGIIVTPFYDIEIEMRKRSAVAANKTYGDTIFGAHGKQELIPINLDYAGAFEINSAETLGITQAEFETLMSSVDNPEKKAYSSIFYNPDCNDENLPFLKAV